MQSLKFFDKCFRLWFTVILGSIPKFPYTTTTHPTHCHLKQNGFHTVHMLMCV